MELTTNRVNLRLFERKDFPLFYSVFSNKEIMRYAWRDEINNEEEMLTFFEAYLSEGEKANKRNSYAFAAFDKEDKKFIGFADIIIQSLNSSGGCGEIGYFLLPEFWGRGYASELAGAMTGFGFEGLKLHKVCACCNANNLNSENVMKKLGMTMEGELRKVRFKRGGWDDEKYYGILREEWLERQNINHLK